MEKDSSRHPEQYGTRGVRVQTMVEAGWPEDGGMPISGHILRMLRCILGCLNPWSVYPVGSLKEAQHAVNTWSTGEMYSVGPVQNLLVD